MTLRFRYDKGDVCSVQRLARGTVPPRGVPGVPLPVAAAVAVLMVWDRNAGPA